MTNSINPQSVGFFAHAGLTLTNNVEGYTKVKHTPNKTETLGNVFLWPVVKLPYHLKNVATQPQVVVVALTVISLASVVFMFHNSSTGELAKLALKSIPSYLTHAKVTAEVVAITSIAGWGIRAYGRLSNAALMKAWYARKPDNT